MFLRVATLTAAVSATAAIGLAAPAALADPATDQFLNDTDAAGLTGSQGDAAVITAGELVCVRLGEGVTFNEIGWMLVSEADISPSQAGEFIAIAAHDLCPQYEPDVTRQAEQDLQQ